MGHLQTTMIFALFCVLGGRFTLAQDPGTKFTKEPPSTIVAILGTDVFFHWKFEFGNLQDWSDFEEIYCGDAHNNGSVRSKYLVLHKHKGININDHLIPTFLQSRLSINNLNISQHECNLEFGLSNVTWSDQSLKYGCTAVVLGVPFRSGPISLVILRALSTPTTTRTIKATTSTRALSTPTTTATIKPTTSPPSITNHSNATLDVDEGDDVNLQCDAIGDPTPKIEWSKGGAVLQSTNTTTTLHIPDIELNDAGTYVCTARNHVGSTTYAVLVRVLRYRPLINKTASSNAMVKSWLNHVTSLKCVGDANPAANFTWFKNGHRISDGVTSTRDVSTLTLTPTNAGDFANYSCNATNVKGTALHHILLEQILTSTTLTTTTTIKPITKDPGTKFTQESPSTLFAILGSNVSFHWKFAFGNLQDWSDFEEIYCGDAHNNGSVRSKYLVLHKHKGITINNHLIPAFLQSRMSINYLSISQHECNLEFGLNNVTWSDQSLNYGCTAVVLGVLFRSGPVGLVILAASTTPTTSTTIEPTTRTCLVIRWTPELTQQIKKYY